MNRFDKALEALSNKYLSYSDWIERYGDEVEEALTIAASGKDGWRPISEAPTDGTEYLLAWFYVPSEEAARNGAKRYWMYATGRYIGHTWTGILGGNPSHFQSINPPEEI